MKKFLVGILALGALTSAFSSVGDQNYSKIIMEELDYPTSIKVKKACEIHDQRMVAKASHFIARSNGELNQYQLSARAIYRMEKRMGRGANLQNAHICEIKVRLTSEDYKIMGYSYPKNSGHGHTDTCVEQMNDLKTKDNIFFYEIQQTLFKCQVVSVGIGKP